MKKLPLYLAAALLALLPSSLFGQERPWPNTTVIGAMQNYNPKESDDFYTAVNRGWILGAKLPEGHAAISPFTERELQVDDEILALLKDKSLKGKDADNVHNLFDLFLDWETRKDSGIQELKKTLALVEGADSLEKIDGVLCGGKSLYMQGANFFTFDIGGDYVNNLKNVLYIYPTNLSLGDSKEYKELSPHGKNTKEYTDTITLFVLKKAGYGQDKAKKIVEEKYEFESKIAGAMMTLEEKKRPDRFEKIMNKVSILDLEKASEKFPIVKAMEALGLAKANRIYLTEPKWLKTMAKVYSEENLQILKSYLIAKITFANKGLLDRETNDFLTRTKCKRDGIELAPTEEAQAKNFVEDCLSTPLSKLYAKRYVDKNAKKRITKIIKDIIKEYRTILEEQDWLCQKTKEKAIDKLNATRIHVAYPAFWDSYNSLNILDAARGENFYTAVQKIRDFEFEKELKWLNKIGGSAMWNGRIFEVNAFNSFTTNSINIIAGIIGGNFYRPDMKDEELYGKMGVIIGHEISHSFDPTGSRFNKFGAMKNWWTEEDLAAFKKSAQKLIDYYNGINSLGSSRQSGQIVQGEAAADMGGVKVMLSLAKKKPDFDYKLFFESFAKTFAFVGTRELAERIINDPHPFNNLRVNVTVQQYDEFLQAYGIKPGDKMYLAPEDRIAIW